ncbi:dimethyl sulfoxide reductase anchor subunit [Shewanella yunxiaonensis]|uniref:Dimethyl sulfoxide reductase anchor subunit n=1 Tax=Shewanella yunxiaonensis TaxID=2829809 RepID=A0ABX7YWA0_9GAMM|nr:DmsC/YnfH family molybdoenzyme membrane anchor subunit [Shewanella yunxiaonensis]QUN07097.1 dimethyl sulfoxide reductase anchor subunit [Shewanella yunxiaonensis]
MGNEWALVFFTSFVALGAGTFMAVGFNEWRGFDPKVRWSGAVAAIILLSLGGFSSVMHLGHPERIFGALGHPTSGIFMESSMIGLTALCIVAYLVALKRNAALGTLRFIASVGVVLAAILAFAVGDSYIMGARPAWDTLILPLIYLMTAVVAACFAYNIMHKPNLSVGDSITTKSLTLLALLVMAVLIIAYVVHISSDDFPDYSRSATRILSGDLAPLFWAGIVLVGIVIPAILALIKPANNSRSTLAIIALVCVFIGAISFRLMMFKLGTSVWQFF